MKKQEIRAVQKKIYIFLFLAATLFLRVSLCFAESKDLTIVFTGDMRGEIENCRCPKEDFGGLSRRSRYLSSVRKQVDDLLLIDVGDVLPLLTAESDRTKVSYDAFISFKAMSVMGYDVMNVGESDLILGDNFLTQKEDSLSFDLVSANIVDYYTQEPFFKPYVIKTMKNGLRVGIFGLINERYVISSNKLDIAPYRKMTEKYVSEIRAQSDIVVLLGHIGLPYSISLAESIEGIDVILSGHWDVDSQEPMKIGNTIVMPTSYHSRKIGRLDLEIERGQVYSYRWESTPLDAEYDGDTVIKDLVSKRPSPEPAERPVILAQDEETELAAVESPLRVMVFYSPGCRSCMEVERDVLPGIEKKYGDFIVIEHYDISLANNYEQMIKLERLYGAEGGYVPEVIIPGYVLMGKEDIAENLDSTIQKALTDAKDVKKNAFLVSQAAEYHPPALDLILSRFESFGMYTVMTAGFLDGINPCAFTTIVFFISFLALVGYKKREMFFAGASFTAAVFLTYFLIGLGIFRFLRALKGFSYVAIGINIAIGSLAFILGILSLVDYIRFKRTKNTNTIILKLPQAIKNRIHSVIGSDFRTEKSAKKNLFRIAWIAFTTGFIVSVLESFCTGQVYLPTIAFVLRIPDRKISAFFYLVIYNLAFIMPLIAVFFLGFFGATSKTFSSFMERRMGLVKLSTAVLFFALGAALLIFR
ncbi:MAG: hypothetical protein KKB46_02830 [Candidatus Omnitrophica bacterium]|nr:hypothetical protein [Candidatus Omnitrophota bacterium]